MFGFKVLLPFFGTIKIHLPQDVADLIAHHSTGIGVTVHAQGPGGVDKLFSNHPPFNSRISQLMDAPISKKFSSLPVSLKNLAHVSGFL